MRTTPGNTVLGLKSMRNRKSITKTIKTVNIIKDLMIKTSLTRHKSRKEAINTLKSMTTISCLRIS